jgi:hypothetical protein
VIFLTSRRWAKVNFGGRPPLYFGYSEPKPSALKLPITSRTRSSLVNATSAIAAGAMPCAGSSTICARRQVTTEPWPRRTIRTSPTALIIIDLTHPRPLSHRPSLTISTPPGNYPKGQTRPATALAGRRSSAVSRLGLEPSVSSVTWKTCDPAATLVAAED